MFIFYQIKNYYQSSSNLSPPPLLPHILIIPSSQDQPGTYRGPGLFKTNNCPLSLSDTNIIYIKNRSTSPTDTSMVSDQLCANPTNQEPSFVSEMDEIIGLNSAQQEEEES